MDREKLRIWAQEWAHNNDIPEAVMDLFLDGAEKALLIQPGITGERLGDHSINYNSTVKSVLEATALTFLKNQRRLKYQ